MVAFLEERRLELPENKSRIIHIHDGFDFLGFNIRKYKWETAHQTLKNEYTEHQTEDSRHHHGKLLSVSNATNSAVEFGSQRMGTPLQTRGEQTGIRRASGLSLAPAVALVMPKTSEEEREMGQEKILHPCRRKPLGIH